MPPHGVGPWSQQDLQSMLATMGVALHNSSIKTNLNMILNERLSMSRPLLGTDTDQQAKASKLLRDWQSSMQW